MLRKGEVNWGKLGFGEDKKKKKSSGKSPSSIGIFVKQFMGTLT